MTMVLAKWTPKIFDQRPMMAPTNSTSRDGGELNKVPHPCLPKPVILVLVELQKPPVTMVCDDIFILVISDDRGGVSAVGVQEGS